MIENKQTKGILKLDNINRIILLMLLFVSGFLNADTNLDKLEQAKASFFSGKLDVALQEFQPLVLTGEAEAQYYTGLIYTSDNWSGRNIEKGISYLRSAADQNNSEAMWKLGDLYENGAGVKKDVILALDWYRKSKQTAVLKSKIIFQKNINNEMVDQSKQDLISELTKDAKNNKVTSQYKLANIYDEGKLVELDVTSAFKWYLKAANNGHKYSMLMTGYMYCRGVGVNSDSVKANEWLSKTDRDVQCN